MRTGRSLTVCWSQLLGGGVCSGGCLLPGEGVCSWGGVCLGGVSAPGGCLLPGGVCSWGLSALGGGVVSALGGSAPRGVYPTMHWGRHPSPLWTDRRLWKYYLGPTSLRPVIKDFCDWRRVWRWLNYQRACKRFQQCTSKHCSPCLSYFHGRQTFQLVRSRFEPNPELIISGTCHVINLK